MKKLWIAALFAAMTGTAAAQTLTFAMEATYPPFESTNEKGDIVGFDVDIANAICEQIKAECRFTNQAFDALIPSLKAKKFDAAISAIDITDARAKQVNFSQPYYDSSASFIALKGTDFAAAKKVGVQNGTTFQQYAVKEAKQYQVQPHASLQSAILDLQNGRIDLIFGDTAVLAEWLKTHDNLEFVGEKVTNPAYFGNGLGIALNKSDKALLNSFNQALTQLKANGEYQKIYDKWFSGN